MELVAMAMNTKEAGRRYFGVVVLLLCAGLVEGAPPQQEGVLLPAHLTGKRQKLTSKKKYCCYYSKKFETGTNKNF
jgi:hypothetical protein